MRTASDARWLFASWCAACAFALPASTSAQGVDLESFRLQGWGPDAQVLGGGGFGLGDSLDNPFVGRLRLGALYAREPWVWNAGVEGQIGGLREWGFGGEIEVNHFKGLFAGFGVGTAQLEDAALHLTVGFTIVGIEWHHRFAPREPQDALLLVVRAPIGLWWFLTKRGDDEEEDAKHKRGGAGASGSGAPVEDPADAEALAAAKAADAHQLERQVLVERELAVRYEQSGELQQAEQALGRAYAYDPQPALLLDLARVEQAQGKLARAVADLERYLDVAPERRNVADTEAAKAQLAQLLPKLGTLRISVVNATGDERIEVDGEVARGALLGYDLRADPGAHVVIVLRGERPLARRRVELTPGTLQRVEIDLANPGPLTDGEAPSPP